MLRLVAAIAAIAAPLSLLLSPSPASAAHTLSATWIVTYYIDPTGVVGATECINFHRKSQINDVITGTWNSPSVPGWSGQWVEKGQHYSWYGTYIASGQTYATYDSGDFINNNTTAETSIGTFSTATPPVTLFTGTATMVQVPSCSSMRTHQGPHPMVGE